MNIRFPFPQAMPGGAQRSKDVRHEMAELFLSASRELWCGKPIPGDSKIRRVYLCHELRYGDTHKCHIEIRRLAVSEVERRLGGQMTVEGWLHTHGMLSKEKPLRTYCHEVQVAIQQCRIELARDLHREFSN